MQNIQFQSKEKQKKYDSIMKKYFNNIPEDKQSIIHITGINYKRFGNNEDYLILNLLYGLLHLKKIHLDNEIISDQERILMELLQETYELEKAGKFKKALLNTMMMDDDLLIFKLMMKYSIYLYGEKETIDMQGEKNNMKAIGYLIPYLTFKESRLLGLFQDIYFQNLYPLEYYQTKEEHLNRIHKIDIPGEYIISINNNMTYLMNDSHIIAKTTIRKKTYFSMYNKQRRKSNFEFYDSIGARVIFRNTEDLFKFVEQFEKKFVYKKKKDYIKTPKDNGYESIHYTFTMPYKSIIIYVELQLRTQEMEDKIYSTKIMSHFNYTVKEHKWAELFKEVHVGYKYLVNHLKVIDLIDKEKIL